MENCVSGALETSMIPRCTSTWLRELKLDLKYQTLMPIVWTSLRMKLTSFILDLKITISIREVFIPNNNSLHPILLSSSKVILLQLLKFTCILELVKVIRILKFLTWCFQLPWIGLLSYGNLRSELIP